MQEKHITICKVSAYIGVLSNKAVGKVAKDMTKLATVNTLSGHYDSKNLWNSIRIRRPAPVSNMILSFILKNRKLPITAVCNIKWNIWYMSQSEYQIWLMLESGNFCLKYAKNNQFIFYIWNLMRNDLGESLIGLLLIRLVWLHISCGLCFLLHLVFSDILIIWPVLGFTIFAIYGFSIISLYARTWFYWYVLRG